jgi:hypothetical protein
MSRKRCGIIVVIVALCLGSCSKPQPTVIIDGWWTIDYARNGCDRLHNCGPNDDNPAGVLDFLLQLRTAFAEERSCDGVRVLEFDRPNGDAKISAAVSKPHETLIVDFEPGQSQQHFGIEGQPTAGIAGNGSIIQIARRTCVIAKGEGAQVQ